jgi:hypothetical protein
LKNFRPPCTGGEDDLYAVRLAFQIAQNERVHLEVFTAAFASSAEFRTLQLVMLEVLGGRLVVRMVSADDVLTSLASPTSSSPEEGGPSSLLIVLGRASKLVASGQDSEGFSGSAAQETAVSVLGPTASRVVAAQGKSAGSKLTPSLFVVQELTCRRRALTRMGVVTERLMPSKC